MSHCIDPPSSDLDSTACLLRTLQHPTWLIWALAGIAGCSITLHHDQWTVAVSVITFVLLLLPAAPSIRPLLWLGKISYSLYLLHVPLGGRVINLGTRWQLDKELPYLLVSTALLVSLIAAAFFHRWFEFPFIQWSRSLGLSLPKVTGRH